MPDRPTPERRHDPRPSSRPRRAAEIVGAALVLGLGVVALASSRGDRSTFLALLLASAVAWSAARLIAPRWPSSVPLVVAVGGVGAAVVSALTDGAIASGAAAALMLAAVACGTLAARAHRRGALLAAVAGVVLLAVAAATAGVAAASLVAVLLAVPALLRPAWARRSVLAVALVFAAALGATVVAAASDAPAPWADAVGVDRLERWRSAWAIVLERPGGVGPGRFDDVPPRLRPEPAARYADHDFLQQGAELGWAGFGLTVALFVWALATLVPLAAGEAVVALVAAAVGALGIHAMFEPVLHAAPVPVLAAALLGSAHALGSRHAPASR